METGRFKFRVWEKDQKIMKEATQLTLDKAQTGSMCDVKGKVTAHLVYQPHYIVMQSTGLKDKNGQLIYEGDVVYRKGLKRYNGEKLYSKVVWDEMYAAFVLSDEGGFHRMPSNLSKTEIVGNIYQNNEFKGL